MSTNLSVIKIIKFDSDSDCSSKGEYNYLAINGMSINNHMGNEGFVRKLHNIFFLLD